MEDTQEKRTRRTPQQIADSIDSKIQELQETINGIEEKKKNAVAEFDAKIETIKQKITGLEEKKKNTLSPRRRVTKKQKMAALLKKAEEAGMKPEDIAEKLGLNTEAE